MSFPDRDQLGNKEAVSNDFMEGLKRSIDEVIPQVKEGVNILLEGEHSHYQTKENVLRGHVCGRAVRVLGYFLRQRGYEAEGWETHLLADDYPTADHAFIMVNDPDGKAPVIVDATFQQFVRIFYLEDDQLPKKDILIMRTDKIDQKAEEFARLRGVKIASHPNPEIFRGYHVFDMSEEELRTYFRKIWNLDLYRLIGKKLEDDLAKYKGDPKEVTQLTGHLIKGLRLI